MMLDELLPQRLTDTAKQLSVDPFEVVRLLVASGTSPIAFRFTAEDVSRLREFGGIESWWDGVALPADDNPRRARVRGALRLLLDRGIIGNKSTRMDNVWRGLPPDDQMVVEEALGILVEEGSLVSVAAPKGLQVAIQPDAQGAIESAAAGTSFSAGLAEFLAG